MVAINTKCSFLDRGDSVLVSTSFTDAYCLLPNAFFNYLSECILKCTMTYAPIAYLKYSKDRFGMQTAEHETRHGLVFLKKFLPELKSILANYEKKYETCFLCNEAKENAEKAFNDKLDALEDWESRAEYGEWPSKEPVRDYPEPGEPDDNRGKDVPEALAESLKRHADELKEALK